MTVTQELRTALIATACLLAGAAGGWWWGGQRVNPSDKVAIGQVVHDYLLEHPEVLPSATAVLQQREDAKQLAGVKAEIETAWPGAVLGNPQGKLILVEFTDFACTYCRRSVADVEALIAANPDLKVIVKQLPIITVESADAARMGLAAAQQGKYAAFHRAMFAAGHPDKATIEAVARSVGIDVAQAQKAMADPRVENELSRNIEIARQLGFSGTPSWIVGDRLLSGAIGEDRLAKAVSEVRG